MFYFLKISLDLIVILSLFKIGLILINLSHYVLHVIIVNFLSIALFELILLYIIINNFQEPTF